MHRGGGVTPHSCDFRFPARAVQPAAMWRLDLTSLEPHFERVFGDKGVLREWFNEAIQYAEALTLAGLPELR